MSLLRKIFSCFPAIAGLLLVISLLGFSACGGDDTVALTVVKGDASEEFTFSELKDMEPAEGWGGFMTSIGTINGPMRYKGVAIKDLLDTVGGLNDDEAIRISGVDGYSMTLSNLQANGEGLIAFDGISGEEVTPPQLTLIAAYEENGQPIAENIGPLRLGILSNESTVTEGHWWIKWFSRIEVVPDILPWALSLEGGITFDMDNGTFESCTTEGCHAAEWQNTSGNTFKGVPLWRLVGYVDDELMHEKGLAFNDELAAAGYEVEIIAEDGYTKTLTSEEIKLNQDIIVAYLIDGEPLDSDHWPLRLVGDDVAKEFMVSQIAAIRIVFPD